MKLLDNKVAIITGASRGIGKAIAQRFAAEGATVCFTYLSSSEKAQALEAELSGLGGVIKGYRSDAGKFEDAQRLVDEVVTNHGRVDVLINNAGITRDNLLMRMTEEYWDEVMAVNLKSVFNLTKAVMKPMLKAKSGSIVNMSSVVGVHGNAGQANYAASKAGIVGFSKSVALELGSRNIRCNTITPGFIESEMTGAIDAKALEKWQEAIPLRRPGKPEDVANLALFLASDLSAYITGQTLSVDGGMYT